MNPDQANWAQYYPQLLGLDNINEETEKDNTVDSDKDNIKHKKVEIADIGCGYGGLLSEFFCHCFFVILIKNLRFS